jgi:8-amino-7-oxononanoate synthase
VLDFTSALYLGLEHPSWSLAQWKRLTAGRPAFLEVPAGARELQRELAALTGCERAVLGPSTFHLYWDLFGTLATRRTAFLLDGGVYAIAWWAASRAVALGSPVKSFASHDPEALRSLLRRSPSCRPVVVVDGYCPARGEPAPWEEYLACVSPHEGLVVIDDTQALGIFGHDPGRRPPFGCGGGGSLRRSGHGTSRVVLLSSMAKAFGVPLAVLAGGEGLIECVERRSVTRVHCSPPSTAAIHAGLRALSANRGCGESLRRRLASRIALFRRLLEGPGWIATPGIFPIQILRAGAAGAAAAIHQELLRRGVRSLLIRGRDGPGARLGFAITARHGSGEIEQAVRCLTDAVLHVRSAASRGEEHHEQAVQFPGRALRLSAGGC